MSGIVDCTFEQNCGLHISADCCRRFHARNPTTAITSWIRSIGAWGTIFQLVFQVIFHALVADLWIAARGEYAEPQIAKLIM